MKLNLKELLVQLLHGKSNDNVINNRSEQTYDNSNLSEITRQMFIHAGVGYQQPRENVFMTEIGGTNCNFKTVLRCDERGNKIFIYAPFPVPVPKHVVGMIDNELIRINKSNKYESEIAIQENESEQTIIAYTNHEFADTPTTDEIKNLMIHTIDIMDNDNFRSILCAIFGFPTYDELKKKMLSNANQQGNRVTMSFVDGYTALHENVKNATSTRYCGRLLALSIHIIKAKISEERADGLLGCQAPVLEVMQEAYNVADEMERDVLRKLRYLIVYAKENDENGNDNDFDGTIGFMEADHMIEEGIYSLL